ncbi:hypothetical protein QE370_000422 [Aeromicrobium sp. SORGH_AS981]|uniref:hypothetical protein n=1 Tax=Aeromicrobium sp. SORGH_AS_0981 TaxID=3041802 RepID=UPI0028637E0A|nr:hypothetical protein [Aeromicrobium sp. SORGH_AS_0981]MDR6117238.1 hypothetical protein [Aeromicrobium sp. SORGH_AS_0981]
MSAPACEKCGTTRDGKRRRGRCWRCYTGAMRRGELVRIEHRTADVLEELEHLGFDRRLPRRPQFRVLAPRLGMTVAALERMWLRHQARGRSAA